MTMNMTRRAVVVFACLGCVASSARAQEPPSPTPQSRRAAVVRELGGQTGATINNAGLQQRLDLSWRRALSTSQNPWLSQAHATLGASTAQTPAHVRGGVWAELAPLSIFVVRAGAEPAYYFGTFDSLSSVDSRYDAFDPDSRHARGGAAAGTAMRLYVTPTLQFRAGRVVGATSADLE